MVDSYNFVESFKLNDREFLELWRWRWLRHDGTAALVRGHRYHVHVTRIVAAVKRVQQGVPISYPENPWPSVDT